MEANKKLGRIPVQIIEIDQDRCAHTYGVAPCNAPAITGNGKCYNTYATCLSKEDYALGDPLTLKFAASSSDLPANEYLIPSLQSVRESATKLNIGGRSGDTKALGVREEVSISLTDHPHSDNFTDPYLSDRSFNPIEKGTFWSKWLKRNPYYNGRSLRVLNGYYGQSLAEMETRHYVIESISLPDSRGNVTIKAQDILRLADNDKAQAPKLSSGKLLTDITETDTAIIITGGDISEYNQGGTNAIRINDEVIRYASITTLSSGDLEFNSCVRASDNTEADQHDADDSVQACLEYIDVRPDYIAKDLLLSYGNIDAAYINATDWDDEGTLWYGSINGTRLITEPIGVTTLLGELVEQFMFVVWWDSVAQLINFKAISPIFGTVPYIDEEKNLLQNSVSLKSDDKQRVSEVWISYLPKNPIDDADERDTYKRTLARIDPTAASDFEYGQRKVYEVYAGWLNNDTQVALLSARLISRYRSNPTLLKFQLDIKDRDLLGIGDVFDVGFRAFVDYNGNAIPVRYQVVSISEDLNNGTISCEAIRFDFDIAFNPGRWMASDAPLYSDATAEEKETGLWWADEDGKINGDDGYLWS